MVKELDETMEKIVSCINENKNFLLEAGAGAGKTYSLIETLKYIRKTHSKRKILCITYTNNAKDEIIYRLNDSDNVIVSTIHSFIWTFIEPFQKELRKEINNLIEEKIVELEAKNDFERLNKYRNADLTLGIKYLNYEALHKGIISHKTLIDIFIKFLSNSNFCKILINSFSYIFIDEYQDADKNLFPKLMGVVNKFKGDKYLVLGLFGDNMQQIFNDGIGQIEDADNNLFRISKLDNYRSCEEIIKISNNFRKDGIVQVCRNKEVLKTKVAFIYNRNTDLYLENFDFGELTYDKFKRLFLVHKQIANEIGFGTILDTYKKKHPMDISNVLKKADERFLDYICKEIMESVFYYTNGDYSSLIKNYTKLIYTKTELLKLKKILDEIITDLTVPIKDFIHKMIKNGFFDIYKYSLIVGSYEGKEDEEFLESILNIPTKEYLNYYRQFAGLTMIETMHGVKGNEFDNVIVNIEEETPWNSYNFAKLIKKEGELKASVKERTEKLLYVACTRAKSALIINFIVDNINKDDFAIDVEKKLLQRMITKIFGDNIEFLVY